MKNIFRTPTIAEKIAQELDQAKTDLLTAQAQAEYWSAMSSMLTVRVIRLEANKSKPG